MTKTIDNSIILSLTNCFNSSPDSEFRYYVKVSHNPHQSLVVRRKDDNKALYINSLKEGDEVLTYRRSEIHWVKFGPGFEGSYIFTNLAKYIAELCNKPKNCQILERDFISLPNGNYISYLLVNEKGFIYYLNIYGRFEPIVKISESIYSSNYFLMPIPKALIDFLIQELRMRMLII